MQNGNDPLTAPYLDIVLSSVGLSVQNGLCIIWALQIDTLDDFTIITDNIHAIFKHHCFSEPFLGSQPERWSSSRKAISQPLRFKEMLNCSDVSGCCRPVDLSKEVR